jgi:hypothetical protein
MIRTAVSIATTGDGRDAAGGIFARFVAMTVLRIVLGYDHALDAR